MYKGVLTTSVHNRKTHPEGPKQFFLKLFAVPGGEVGWIPRIIGTYYGAKAAYGYGKRAVKYFTPKRAPYRGSRVARVQRLYGRRRLRVRAQTRAMPRYARRGSTAFRRRVRSGYYEKSYAGRGYHAKRARGRGARRYRRPLGRKRFRKKRHTYRVLSLGQPQQKTIKLRTRLQCAMQTSQDSWLGFRFDPANIRQPFKGMKLTETADGMYTGANTGIWLDRNVATPAITNSTLQVQGLDHYMATGAATPGMYSQFMVKGCKITITQNPDVTDASTFKFVGGFTKLWPLIDTHGPLIGRVYKNVLTAETDDMMTTGLMKNPKRFMLAPEGDVRGKSWVFKYSQRKHAAEIRRYNPTQPLVDWFGTFDADPGVNPACWFILSDTSKPTADTNVSLTVVIEYVVQFRDLEAVNRSTL